MPAKKIMQQPILQKNTIVSTDTGQQASAIVDTTPVLASRLIVPGIKKIATYTSPKTKKQVFIFDVNKTGIAFEMENGRCVGITVHQPGEVGYETYNSLFTDVNFL
jgi:hypothetical protein